MPQCCRSLAHLEHELMYFVIRVRVESEPNVDWDWSNQLRLSKWNNIPTLENVADCISLEMPSVANCMSGQFIFFSSTRTIGWLG